MKAARGGATVEAEAVTGAEAEAVTGAKAEARCTSSIALIRSAAGGDEADVLDVAVVDVVVDDDDDDDDDDSTVAEAAGEEDIGEAE